MSLSFALFILSISCVVKTHGQINPTETYSHRETFQSGNITILLYWKFTQTDITFEVHGQTQGWIGIGFSPNGAMTRSDIYVGWVKDGRVKVTDRHGIDTNGFPLLDPEQNIDVITGKECDGWTMFKLKRELAACDDVYDRQITQNTERVIWAFNENDPTGDDIKTSDHHGLNRGVSSLQILDKEINAELPVGSEYKTFDVRVQNLQIPADDTYYNCKISKVPELHGVKHHIVKFEPVIQEGNELNVHHILVHQCGDVLEDPTELEVDERCYNGRLEHSRTCTTLIAAWAIGGKGFVYPENVGFSIGTSGDPKFIQIETHYDNPSKSSTIIDSSGIRFTYTPDVRQHDAGMMQVGVTVSPFDHLIPPRAESFTSYGFCEENCLKKTMDASGVTKVNVLGVGLHSHLAGRALRLRHIRNGVELKPIGADETYDFNYQDVRYLNPEVELKSTDELQMECVYETKQREHMTEGGLSTHNEMCLAFLLYYPKINLARCSSVPFGDQSWSWFGINGVEINPAGTRALDYYKITDSTKNSSHVGMTVLDVMSQYDWTEENIDRFSTDLLQMIQSGICVPKNISERVPTSFQRPAITEPYQEPEVPCTWSPTSLTQERDVGKCNAGFFIQPVKTLLILPFTLYLGQIL